MVFRNLTTDYPLTTRLATQCPPSLQEFLHPVSSFGDAAEDSPSSDAAPDTGAGSGRAGPSAEQVAAAERAEADLEEFKKFLVGTISTRKDWAVWASGLGSFIRRWKGASIVAKRSLLLGPVPFRVRNTIQISVQPTATARRER